MVNIRELLKIDKRIILASQSPRRKNLLLQLGLNFDIIPADFNENIDENLSPEDYCVHLAYEKASFVAGQINEDSIIIGADTIVVINNKILNKPSSEEDAFNMLKLLSGNTHFVYTGIAFVNPITKKSLKNFQISEVTFRELENVEISAYIASGSPMDKAGSYGIQDDFGAVFVREIKGCYYNIVGLPLELFYQSLKKFINDK